MHILIVVLIGISFACVGVAGMLGILFSRQKHPSTDDCEPKNIKEDLEDDEDDQFFDAETGSCRSMKNENLQNITQSKSIEKLHEGVVEKQAFRDLQHEFEVCKMNCLVMKRHMTEAIQMLQLTVSQQELTIETLQLGISDVKTDLNRLVGSVDLLRTEMTSTERNSSEKPDSCKIGRLKTRISILEREVTENCSKIIGMDSTFRTLLLMRGNSGWGAAVADEIRVDRSPSNTDRHQPSKPISSSFTLAGPPPVRSVPVPPPPPPPPIPSGFGPPAPPPPPPVMMMTTETPTLQCEVGKKTSKETESGKNAPKTYSRILITEEILKSVVLKPAVRRT